MKLRKIENIKNTVKQSRYMDTICKYNSYLLIESDNLNKKDTLSIRKKIEDLDFKFKMTLKRLIHKLFLGDRKSNEKTIFKNNLYLIIVDNLDNDFSALDNLLKQYPVKIIGLVYNNNYIVNYSDYTICKFKKELAIYILIQVMLLPLIRTVNCLINKLTSNK